MAELPGTKRPPGYGGDGTLWSEIEYTVRELHTACVALAPSRAKAKTKTEKTERRRSAPRRDSAVQWPAGPQIHKQRVSRQPAEPLSFAPAGCQDYLYGRCITACRNA